VKKRTKRLLFIILLLLAGTVIFLLPTKLPKDAWSNLETELEKHKSTIDKQEIGIYIDYNKPVFKKRLWIVNLKTKEVILNSHVSHAWNSGFLKPTKFSNEVGSNTSCSGTFNTLNSYESQFGTGEYKIGMRIQGLDKNRNDNALKRNIVFHSSYSPWSSGCFMSTPKTNKKIIELTRNGCIVVAK